MLNIFSYVGVSLQSELCLWTLLGLIRTVFDATLFKVNANLKQVWQMSMPEQLSMPVQRVMRTIISGVMLVQCFTVYVYLASYIVLLYPVFLEERPTLVLPWLLLAAIRKFLCELTSLTLGLGACVLLGAARPPCIRFVVFKVASITPAFYMWMLVFSYYNTLKVASAYQRFPASTLTTKPSDHDYGLELAVRRRRTKSLQGEEHLRRKLVASLNYGESESASRTIFPPPINSEVPVRMVHSTHTNFQDQQQDLNELFFPLTPLVIEPINLEAEPWGAYLDWFGSEIIVPRDADRILEQFSMMMLRIAVCLKEDGSIPEKLFSTHSSERGETFNNMDCSTPLHGNIGETSPLVSTQGKTASYVQNYPQIFMKKASEAVHIQNESILNSSQPPNVENTEERKEQLQEDTLPLKFSAKNNQNFDIKSKDRTNPSENLSKTQVEAEPTTNINNPPKVIDTQSATSNMIKEIKYEDIEPKRIDSQPIDLPVPNKSMDTKQSKKMDGNVKLDINRHPKNKTKVSQKNYPLEKDIKPASEEPYTSQTNVSHTTSNLKGDSLDAILKRMKKSLKKQNQQQKNETTQESGNPTTTRALNNSEPENDNTTEK